VTPDIVTLVAQTSGVMGLALFSIWMLNKVWESRLDEAKRYAAEIAEQRRDLSAALNRNTEVMTRLCERLEK
jgi:uncharacterized protein YeeX (DUF496 family)